MESSNLPPDDRDRDEHVPDPTGPPIAAAADSLAWGAATVLAVAAGVFVAPAFLSVGRTAGATRSARLEWERRSKAIAEVEASQSTATEHTATEYKFDVRQ